VIRPAGGGQRPYTTDPVARSRSSRGSGTCVCRACERASFGYGNAPVARFPLEFNAPVPNHLVNATNFAAAAVQFFLREKGLSYSIVRAAALLVVLAGCASKSYPTPAPCDGPITILDAGTDAFAGGGAFLEGAVCGQFCDTSLWPLCELATDTSVRCKMRCPRSPP